MKTEEGGKQGSSSHSTGKKLVFSQFTKNTKSNSDSAMKITVHDEMRIFFAFHIEKFNNFAKTMLHGYLMKINENHYHGEEKLPFRISRETKRVDHESRKYPLPAPSLKHLR